MYLLSAKSVLFPTSMMMTSLPLSVLTSSIHFEVCWNEFRSANKKCKKTQNDCTNQPKIELINTSVTLTTVLFKSARLAITIHESILCKKCLYSHVSKQKYPEQKIENRKYI